MIYPVRRFFVEDAPIQDVKFLRNSEHLIAVSLKNKQSWTYEHSFVALLGSILILLEYGQLETKIFFVIVIGPMPVNSHHQHLMTHYTPAVHMPGKSIPGELHGENYGFLVFSSNQNELLSVSTHSILLPGQNVANHLPTSMLSTWQIVSLDYSEWIDAVGYADLDGI